MRIYGRLISSVKNESGVTAILVAIVITVLIGFTALAVDVGYVMTARNELQNIADGAALAATRQLGAIYQGMSYDQQQNYVCNPSTIRPIAQDVGGKNRAAGQNITIDDADIIIGQWDANALMLHPTLLQPDAVRVTARRDGGSNGPITTFFARILGINTVDVTATATAALTGQGTTEEGELELPVGISRYFFEEGHTCNDWIKFSPTKDPDACAGWTSWDYNPNDNNLRKILREELESPATTAGIDDANFIGGDLSVQTFNSLLMLFKDKGYDYDPDTDQPIQLDGDGRPMPGHTDEAGVPLFADDGVTRLTYPDGTPRNYHKWETKVVVYDWYDCDNPNTSIRIAGYAIIELIDVVGPPDKLLRGKILCNLFSNEDTRGGGGDYGVKGSIPGLVE